MAKLKEHLEYDLEGVADRRNINLILFGDSYDEAYEHAMAIVAERGLTFIHPFDDPDVIAGQGTIAMEILRQHPEPPHAIFVPVGGGGLIAGVAPVAVTGTGATAAAVGMTRAGTVAPFTATAHAEAAA